MDVEKKNDLIAKIADKEHLKEKIQNTVDMIKLLENDVNSTIYNYVQDAEDVDTAVAICKEFGIPSNRRWMEKAFDNSNSECINHDETEWYDVLSSIEFEVKQQIDKHAKDGFKYTK
jgi:hypothetical protein